MENVEEIAHAIAGAGGGALSMIVTYPLVTLSTLAQTTKRKTEEKEKEIAREEQGESNIAKKALARIKKSSTVISAQEITKQKGIFGLYAGLESALYGIMLTNFIYYYFYELTSNVFLRTNALNKRKGRGLSTIQSIITGMVAGAFTCIGSNPFWVANTRMMTAKKENSTSADRVSNSTFRMLVEIVKQDGVGTLFAGVLPALVLVINPIIQYTIFEQVKNVIMLRGGRKSFTAVKAFFIGAFGKLIATSLTYPYITLKSRMHVKKKKIQSHDGSEEKEKKLSMFEEMKKIVLEEGIEGLYGGLTVKLTQSISTAAFLFYFKEELMSGSVQLVNLYRMLRVKKAIA